MGNRRMKAKYWQWLKEKEKTAFRSMSNTNKRPNVNDQGIHEHLMSRYVFFSSAWSLLIARTIAYKRKKKYL